MGRHRASRTLRSHELNLVVTNLYGALAPGGVRYLHRLDARPTDRTDVDYHWSAPGFVPHYGQRLSAAVVSADARRCLKVIPGQSKRAAAAAPRANPRALPTLAEWM